MNYKKYFIEFIVVSGLMTSGLHYFIDQTWQDAAFIGIGAAVLTVANKVYLDKKALKKQNQPKP